LGGGLGMGGGEGGFWGRVVVVQCGSSSSSGGGGVKGDGASVAGGLHALHCNGCSSSSKQQPLAFGLFRMGEGRDGLNRTEIQ
jgi:hypothetical protein